VTGESAQMTKGAALANAHRRYQRVFDAFAANGAGDAPEWLKERRAKALAGFMLSGFPTGNQEAWRFTDIKAIARTEFDLAPAAAVTGAELEGLVPAVPGARRAVFVNGRFSAGASSLEELPAGVRFGSLRDFLDTDGDRIRAHLGAHASTAEQPFGALNTAFLADGAYVYVPKHVVLEHPLQVVFAARPAKTPTVAHPRLLVVTEQGARAEILESYVGVGDGVYWSNATTEVVLGESAKVDLYRYQQEGPQAFHTAITHSQQARDSVFKLATFGFGANLSRHDVTAVLDGEGADCTLDGLSLMRGRQHTDAHTTLVHAAPNCTSWEYFNGIFDDRARGVFTGRIVVRPGAQKTDSKQTNNNLLLSETARADSQPQLEIYADDVKCTHGATLGPMDDDHVFYLQARGLSMEMARAMLTYGFASEILDVVSDDVLRQQLDAMVRDWLGRDIVPLNNG
jgi:Fe-S cluster assembly protein SufD